jgi:hypothetical protein
MTTIQTTRGPQPLTVVTPGTSSDSDECEVCGIVGPVAVQQVGDDPDATFLLCAPCGTPAVNNGMARWLPRAGV